jgi:hypothetical protein
MPFDWTVVTFEAAMIGTWMPQGFSQRAGREEFAQVYVLPGGLCSSAMILYPREGEHTRRPYIADAACGVARVCN